MKSKYIRTIGTGACAVLGIAMLLTPRVLSPQTIAGDCLIVAAIIGDGIIEAIAKNRTDDGRTKP